MKTLTSSFLQDQLETVQSWAHELDTLVECFAPHFARIQSRQQALGYLQGLLSSIERKNGWQLAEHLGHATPYRLQHLLGRAVWDQDKVRDQIQSYVCQHLGDPEGVLVVDETGFLKKGEKSAGVARQYSGTAGRIENCQVGVFLSYASSKGHTFLDRQLYLPQEWAQDKLRREEADIPEEVCFTTKPKIARQMLQRAFDAGVPCRWVTGDSVYGNDRSLRLWLQERKQAHVLAVTGQEMVTIEDKFYRVKELLPLVSEQDLQILSAGEGSKGLRLYAWTRIAINHGHASQWGCWLLVRKSLSDPKEVTGYIAFAPVETSLETLVQIAGTRWTIECCFESAKGELGLDEYEVRSWQGWHRHMTLAMLAHAFLSVLRFLEGDLGSATVVSSDTPPHAGCESRQEFSSKKGVSPPRNSLRVFKQSRGLSSV